ncbi:MAG TPA: sugar ABC transporter substrate-binding protein [Candidatus Acidoferrales bacterium]|nr:sugar ABC transporter substrate-binding protein [Candidatus Acidoferrales bacterium]
MTLRATARARVRATVAFAVAALAVAALAAGCAARGGGTTLRFWAMGREGEVVQQLMPAFEREHPGVHVIVQQIPWTAAHEKLITAYVGRSTPDVSQLGNTWVPEFTALHAIEPLRPWLASSTTLDSTKFFHGIWDTNVIDGAPMGVPWYVDTRLLFYRRDVLRAAGYDSMPQSWAEWKQALRAMKRVVGPGKFAIFLPTNEWNPPIIFGLQAGSPILKDDGTRAAFRDSAFRAGFDFYMSLFRENLAPSVSGNEIANVYQEFARRYFNAYITGPWQLGEFRNRLPDSLQGAWATSPLPGPTGAASGVSLAGGSSLVLFRASRAKPEAWALIEYLARPDVQLEFWRLSGDLPGRLEAWRDTALTHDPNTRAFGVQLERVVPTPKVPEWEEIANRLQDYVERAVRGTATPDVVLAQLSVEVDRLLEKRRWLHGRALAAGSVR